jgi:hypothetical protein
MARRSPPMSQLPDSTIHDIISGLFDALVKQDLIKIKYLNLSLLWEDSTKMFSQNSNLGRDNLEFSRALVKLWLPTIGLLPEYDFIIDEMVSIINRYY